MLEGSLGEDKTAFFFLLIVIFHKEFSDLFVFS